MIRRISEYILGLNGFLAPEICQAIIDEYGQEPHLKRAVVVGGKEHPSRTCSQLQTSQTEILDRHHRRTELEDILHGHMAKAIALYRSQFPVLKLGRDTGYLYLRYDEGQFYKQHIDEFPDELRLATISIALNDDFEGGEWAWFDRAIVTRFKQGDAVMFPSNWMFPHEIMPVTKGTRHAIITWFLGNDNTN